MGQGSSHATRDVHPPEASVENSSANTKIANPTCALNREALHLKHRVEQGKVDVSMLDPKTLRPIEDYGGFAGSSVWRASGLGPSFQLH